MSTSKNIVYLSAALGMLIYAVPRLEIGQGWTMPTVFGAVWMMLALVIIASHLHAILRVDEETEKQIRRVKMFRRRQIVQATRRMIVRRG